MVRLREIPRTSTFAWSTGSLPPLLATGTRAGAVDADFSNETQLELWDLGLDRTDQPFGLKPVGSIGTDSRFHDIAWSEPEDEHASGIIAGALENGCLDLWDATKLQTKPSEALISRTSKHGGAIKSLQFNPFRHELLATAGVKGELYISDLNNVSNPFRLGTTARAEDFETVDWNKRVPHILATGSSGGFVTVWDVKTKKESLTLNHYGRKPVSAVAWDPNTPTRLLTAIPNDQDPLILMWDLRNTNTPERILKGHDQGVLSLSWCEQDNELLLSCGKDNRTICWNPLTGQPYGEFPIVTNWTFQTRWNPRNPGLLATASFDGKIAVQTIQNTKAETNQRGRAQDQALDGEDFFSKAQTQPQGVAFSLPKPPKWLERPVGVSFGFGGKVVKVGLVDGQDRKSTISISTFVVDSQIGSETEKFENALKGGDISGLCERKLEESTTDMERGDWSVVQTLLSQNPRKELLLRLGFADASNDVGNKASSAESETAAVNGTVKSRHTRNLSNFFDNNPDDDSFLGNLAATKGAKTNNPFSFYSGSESEAEQQITRALVLGSFEKAMDICLKEDRMSDAFMIAVCGGQKCLEKAQAAYFTKKAGGPSYLRLLASVVGKNLWDIVYNADLLNWKEVMATICTFADQKEFSDLCEALGDRLEEAVNRGEQMNVRRQDASFCFLAGSKLEKVVSIWLQESEEAEKAHLDEANDDTGFSVHARYLQNFVEKVTVFRQATGFRDPQVQDASEWKLAALYAKYTEYADILAAHGQLETAGKYLDLLPAKYSAADVARNRVKQATRKKVPQAPAAPQNLARAQQNTPTLQREPTRSGPGKPAAISHYAPTSSFPSTAQQPQNPYAPSGVSSYAPPGLQLQQQNFPQGPQAQTSQPYAMGYQQPRGGMPPARNATPSAPPPPKAKDMGAWNDTPDVGNRQPLSRRGTPGMGPQVISSPFPNQPNIVSPPPTGMSSQMPQQRAAPPLPPPPRAGAGPQRFNSPPMGGMVQTPQSNNPAHTTSNPYAPQQLAQDSTSASRGATIPRGPSPYNPPPSYGPSQSNRYAPTASTQQAPAQYSQPMPSAPPPNPYAPRQLSQASAAPMAQPAYQSPPPQAPYQVPPQGPPRIPSHNQPPHGPPPASVSAPMPVSRPSTAQSQRAAAAAQPKYPPGDRSHIPEDSQSIFEILNTDMQRVKGRAPPSFMAQVVDTEKRLSILFDHLNNEDLPKDTVSEMDMLAQSLQSRDYDAAQAIIFDVMKAKVEQGQNWMVGVKRLLAMSKATPT